MTLKDRILELLQSTPGLTDRELANRLLGREAQQQSVNQAARQLAAARRLVRRPRSDTLIGNYLASNGGEDAPFPQQPVQQQPADGFMAEDDVKRSVQVASVSLTVTW